MKKRPAPRLREPREPVFSLHYALIDKIEVCNPYP